MTEPASEPILVSPWKYTAVFASLLLLLAATYGLAHVDLGWLNTPVGLLIAAAKALLVVLYFMHLRYTSGIQRVAAGVGVFWLGILLALTLTDYLSRGWLALPSHWPG